MKSLIMAILLFPSLTLAEESAKSWNLVDSENAVVFQRLDPVYSVYRANEFKLQVSFQTPIVRTWPLYFGYTQLMFYDFDVDRKLFADVTYNPQIYYRFNLGSDVALTSIDLGIFDHNSNGKPLDDHRSYDKSYLRLNFDWANAEWLERFSIQGQYLYEFESTNLDIQEYIGPLSFQLVFLRLFPTWVDQSRVTVDITPGGRFAQRWDHGSFQISWSFRLGGLDLVPAFYVQYYNGYAESLLNYSQHVDVLRAGLIL